MHEIEIALRDVNNTPTWSVPGTKLFLSFETPGPIKVDIDLLTTEQKKVIALDLSRRTLVGKNVEVLLNPEVLSTSNPPIKGGGSLAKSYSKVQLHRDVEEGYLVAQKQTVVEVPELNVIEERKSTLKTFLAQHVATVKKDLSSKSLSELRILKDLESQDKKRASVIKLIDTLISKAQTEVFESIQKDFSSKSTIVAPTDLPAKYLGNVTDVVESDEKEVTIELGTDED